MAVSWKQRVAQLCHALRAAILGRPAAEPPHSRHPAQAGELEALAQRLHDFERQLGRARGHYARRQLSHQELEQICRRTVEEVQALLRPLSLADQAQGPSWATERLRRVLGHWQEHSADVTGQPLQQADVSDLQARLLEVTTALYVCARVEDRDGGW